MGKNKFWQKSFNASDIAFILKKIKSQRHVSDDGKVSFSGSWGFEGLFSIVSSAIPESEITEAAKSRVVAEGVETHEALESLIGLGCDEAQGYFFSRPIIAEQIHRWQQARDETVRSAA
ncbi:MULTISPECIES: EAL domain-containing protein [Alphaproteobacteria]|uniref:EAL domain-containing protein n=1 Tax=Ponticaulis profundi TaxID=2665222 RepID=A0ABW1SAN4_9PROT|nr:EAL domain-containing protein [Paracoccus marcusii]